MREMIESLGLLWAGEALGLVMFTDPLTRSTLAVRPGAAREEVERHVAESRAKFGVVHK